MTTTNTDEITAQQAAEHRRILECLEQLTMLLAPQSRFDGKPCVHTDGKPHLVEAFEILGWREPRQIPETR